MGFTASRDHDISASGSDINNNKGEGDKIELLYDGYLYNVTSWITRHPGGDIIKLYTDNEEDATLAIQQFHYRAKDRVMSLLKALPRRPAEINSNRSKADLRHKMLTDDFQRLTKELIDEGHFEPNPVRYALRILQAFIIFVVGLSISYKLGQTSLIWRIVSVIVISLAGGQGLWLAHEGGHNAFTGVRKYDRIAQIITYGFIFGLSASSWNSTHSEHHAMPQHLTHDADLRTLPLLAFNKKLVKKPSLAKSFWLRNQKWLFALCDTFLVTVTWKFNHHIKYCIKNRKWFDLFCMACHYSLVPTIGFIDWLGVTWLGSIYVLGNLILSHTHLPVVEDGKKLHWVEYAFFHTTNIRSSWWVDWWTGHLNYQIEHHLWPTMPEYKNKLVSKKARAFAQKHDLPYHLCDYWDAVKNTYSNLDNVSKEIRHIM